MSILLSVGDMNLLVSALQDGGRTALAISGFALFLFPAALALLVFSVRPAHSRNVIAWSTVVAGAGLFVLGMGTVGAIAAMREAMAAMARVSPAEHATLAAAGLQRVNVLALIAPGVGLPAIAAGAISFGLGRARCSKGA